MSLKVGSVGKEYREYIRNLEPWQEKLPRSARILAWAIGKKLEKFQKQGKCLSPSVTSMHDPLNNYDLRIHQA
jgi:hypothetical protein